MRGINRQFHEFVSRVDGRTRGGRLHAFPRKTSRGFGRCSRHVWL